MRIVAGGGCNELSASDVETVSLTNEQLQLLECLSRGINPAMPVQFGGAHAIRLLLEHLERTEVDLSAASSEAEVSQLATTALRPRR